MNNRADTRPSLGGIVSACHDRQKSNNYVLCFYQYVMCIPKLTVIFNNFSKNLHSLFNADRFSESYHHQTQKIFTFRFMLILLKDCRKSLIVFVCECLNISRKATYGMYRNKLHNPTSHQI